MKKIVKNTAKNTALLYLLTFAKLVFPLITLPYLTRVLTTEGYGVVAYVKSCMSYMQIIIDFGFILSAVKDIVASKGDYEKIGEIVGQVVVAKLILAIVIFIATIILCCVIPILKNHKLFTILYVLSIMITAFSTEYLFRGIERMQLITIVYVLTKGTVTILTFFLVKGDNDLSMIPVMEVIGNCIGVIVTWVLIKKLKITVRFKNLKFVLIKLKNSAIYFFSSFSATVFTALNTILIGAIIEDLSQVAYWSVSWQLIGAVLALYSPIIDGVYPQMLQSKDLKFIKKMLLLIMPIIFLGCAFCFFCANMILYVFAGKEYIAAAAVFKLLIPMLLFSFPSMLLGWPTLGCIEKENFVTASTIVGAIFQGGGLVLLIILKLFTIYSVAVLRCLTEILIMFIRFIGVIKYRKLFLEVA